MNELSFETLVMPAEFYEGIIKIVVIIMVVSILLMIVLAVVFRHREVNIPMMWYINVPKIVVLFMAIVLVFCFNYETRQFQMPKVDNMLMTTFLVGILAIIELLATLASMIKEVCDKLKRN